MPIGGFLPASLRYGQQEFPGLPDTGSDTQGILQTITAGLPQFDPASLRRAPVPRGTQSTPGNAAHGVNPGGLGGGIEAGLPFSVQAGLSTGPGPSSISPAGGSATSSSPSQVVANMIQQTAGGANAGGPPQPGTSVTEGQAPPFSLNQLYAAGPSFFDLLNQMMSGGELNPGGDMTGQGAVAGAQAGADAMNLP